MKISISFLLKQILAITFAIFLVGCGSNGVVIKPNYDSKYLSINKSDSVKARVIDVVDKRNVESDNAGECKVGMFNKTVPYKLNEPVPEFVKKSITKLLSDTNDSLYLPLKVIINSFAVSEKTGVFSEKGYFNCDLTFIFPGNADSLSYFNTSVQQESSGLDVTNGLEVVMYTGISKCTEMFADNLSKIHASYRVSNNDTLIFKNQPVHQTELINTNSGKVEKSKNSSYTNFGAGYCSGSNVIFGIQLAYQNYDSIKTNFWGGFGYTFLFYDVDNKSKNLEGNFINFNYRYFVRYFLASGSNGPYLGGGLKLSFGSETIDYITKKQTNFFIGPTIEEVIGIMLGNKVYLELGSYQLKLFGSDLLPDDVGFTVGFYFRI